jgi:hypothetical protein
MVNLAPDDGLQINGRPPLMFLDRASISRGDTSVKKDVPEDAVLAIESGGNGL